jgi:hypothetical protein
MFDARGGRDCRLATCIERSETVACPAGFTADAACIGTAPTKFSRVGTFASFDMRHMSNARYGGCYQLPISLCNGRSRPTPFSSNISTQRRIAAPHKHQRGRTRRRTDAQSMSM